MRPVTGRPEGRATEGDDHESDLEGRGPQRGRARRAAARGARPRAEEDARRGVESGSRHPRPDAGPDLRRENRLLPDLREALRDRREPPDLAAARRRHAHDQRRRPDRHHQAPPGREVQRRDPDDRRGREVLPRPAPRAEGLHAGQRAGAGGSGRGGRPAGRALAPEGGVLPAARPTHRPGRHARVTGGGQEARRQVRHRPGLRGAVAVRRAGGPGPDRRGAIGPLLRPRAGAVRQDHFPDHPR